MNTTSLHIKIESDIKKQAQKTADDLGLSLSAVTKVLLKQFIRTKRLSVGVRDMPEIPNARTRQVGEGSLGFPINQKKGVSAAHRPRSRVVRLDRLDH
jgi:addiction module RelB/DinJ family antitoxin